MTENLTVSGGMIEAALAAGKNALNEWEAKRLLAAYGIPVPEGALATCEAEAVEAAARIRGKVVMKGVAASIHHKTEAGLVVVGVEGADAAIVAETYRVLQARSGGVLEAVLVERMIGSNRELMVGMKRDRAFGPVVAFGLGGVLTEALGDVALAVAPVSDGEANGLPGLIKAKKLLGPFRGYPPVDRVALAKVLQAVGQMALDHPEIAEIDVNPLLVQGDQPVAADALIILARPGEQEVTKDTFVPNLKALVAPRSMAVVGASADITKWGGSALRSILDGGYTGTIYPVNPKAPEVFGLRAYPSIEALPEPPDLALLAVGSHQIAPMLAECGRKGIPAAIAIAAGFSETGGSGVEAEREITRIATEGGVTLMGPNCMGMISNEVSLHAVGFIVLHPPKGSLSFVSQSGNIGVQTVYECERRGIGIDKFLSLGNEARIGVIDTLDYLRDDPGTACVMAYVEGIDDGRRFVEAARRATTVKPVVVLRTGLTEYGGKAAASHTGAMAGSAGVWEAAARQAGVITCTTTQEVIDLGSCLAYNPLPRGRRVAVVTNGGGAGVMAADEVARHNLELAEFPPELCAAVDEILPPFWSRRNPLDMVASAGGDVAFRVLRLVAACDSVDCVMVLSCLGVRSSGGSARPLGIDGEYLGLSVWETNFMTLVAELMEATGKPIINVPDSYVRGSLFDLGHRFKPILLGTPQAAARALDRMEWYSAWRRAASS